MIDSEQVNQSQRTTQEAKSAESFKELGVCEELVAACKALNWHTPTPIQAQAIPWALEGRDIIGLAETGSGKTATFAIPVIQNLLDNPQKLYAVVLAPTRELCVQIGQCFESLGASISLKTVTLVGGLDMVTQALKLAEKPHVVIASPGRLLDHLENTKGFHLRQLKYLVLDEADRLLSMDFEEPIDKLLQVIPKQRNTFLFSATMTSKVAKLQRASLTKPVKCEVSSKYHTVKTLVSNFLFLPWKFKHTWLGSIVGHYSHYSIIIFTETCLAAQKVAIFLRHMGHQSIALHGSMSQPQRLGALNSFKSAAKKILVATDVASRGLDIPHVDVVINFEIPKNSKDYIHRVGRTARAGRSGRAITFVTQYDIEAFQRIEKMLGKKLDDFKEVTEETTMSMQEKSIEALRTAELELKEGNEGKDSKMLKRKMNLKHGKGKKKR